MEEGSLRCDANVSVRPAGESAFGVKTELKNLNSFRHVQRALEHEIDRQIHRLEQGDRVVQETRLWDAAAGRTVAMRGKEEADDYRYFPEPDLLPLEVGVDWIAEVRGALPELPDARRRRFVSEYHLPDYDAGVLTQSMALAEYFEKTAAEARNPKAASNWIMVELTRKMNELGLTIEQVPLAPDALAELIALIDRGEISGPVAKDVFEKMFASGRRAGAIVEAEGLRRIDDEGAIAAVVADIVQANPGPVAQFRAGRTQTFGFLVGQVMKATRGKANPETVNAILRRALAEEHAGD
jgi:aspartyl-tRNA(Asn)/glutamyl-tRNA(Gln) amidotransferase subunit B